MIVQGNSTLFMKRQPSIRYTPKQKNKNWLYFDTSTYTGDELELAETFHTNNKKSSIFLSFIFIFSFYVE